MALTLVQQLRKPFRDEVYLYKTDDSTELRLSREARHYTEVAVVVSLRGYVSLKPTYKRGTLPPAFNYVDNEFSLALQFGAKAQTKKDEA
jgi:hypothetical protein